MKKLTQLFTALVFLSLSIFISCNGGDDDDDDPDVRIAAGEELAGAWTLDGATKDGAARAEWDDGFSLTVAFNTDTFVGTFTGNSVPTNEGATDVWPGSSTFTFGGTDETPALTTLQRSDGIDITVGSVSPTSLVLNFTVPESGGRTFDGTWTFTFSK